MLFVKDICLVHNTPFCKECQYWHFPKQPHILRPMKPTKQNMTVTLPASLKQICDANERQLEALKGESEIIAAFHFITDHVA
jgi:hypothetical protein